MFSHNYHKEAARSVPTSSFIFIFPDDGNREMIAVICHLRPKQI